MRLFILMDLVTLCDIEPVEENEITKETASKRSFRISQQKQFVWIFVSLNFLSQYPDFCAKVFKKICIYTTLSEEGLIFFLGLFCNPLLQPLQ